MSTVELPDGHTAVLKDPASLTNRERKVLRKAVLAAMPLREKLTALGVDAGNPEMWGDRADQISEADLEILDAVQAAFIVVYLHSWDLDADLPTMATIDELPGPVYDALATASSALGDATVDREISTDPTSPTSPSGDSGNSEGALSSTSL